MSNAIFQFIKILVLNDSQETPSSEDFLKAMSNNYYLDSLHQHVMDDEEDCDCHEHHHHDEEIMKAASLCEWADRSPEIIDQLPIGALFKGVTKDSLMYSYQVVAKTKDGKSIWYPISAEFCPVAVVAIFDWETKDYETIFAEDYVKAYDMLLAIAQPGNFYRITDTQNNPVDIFDDDEDDSENGIYYCSDDGEGDIDFRSVKSIIGSMNLALKFKEDYTKLICKLHERTEDDTPDENGESKADPEEMEVSDEVPEEETKEETSWVI